MNYLDIIISILLIYGVIKGFENGLIKEVTGVIALISGLYIAIQFSSFFEPKIINYFDFQKEFIPIITFALLFFVTFIIFKLLGYIIDKFFKVLALGFISKVLGSIFGILKVIVILSFLISMTNKYELINKKIKQQSILFYQLELCSETIIPEINKYKNDFLENTKKNTEKVKESINQKINSE